MKKIEWDKLTLAEIREIQKDALKAEKAAHARDLKEARAAAEAAAAKFGFSLAELLGAKTAAKGAKSDPKYAHPENPAKTWTGKGRQPDWIKQHVASGKSLDALLIAK